MNRILVIGESCTDIFVYGTSNRKSPEGNGPVFVPISETYGLGMASNVVNNLRAMGAANMNQNRNNGDFYGDPG
jgi:bifunctional ADP-heptose synthase (sugar kinase/adenylyltransferase)